MTWLNVSVSSSSGTAVLFHKGWCSHLGGYSCLDLSEVASCTLPQRPVCFSWQLLVSRTMVAQPQLSTGSASEDQNSVSFEYDNTYSVLLECHLEEDGTSIRISFDSQVIEKLQVQRMAEQLEQVLRQICEKGNNCITVKDVDTMSKRDLRDVWLWNQTLPLRVDRCVHSLVEERCRAQPTAAAVCAWDGDFTYGELDARASALAGHLAARGVGPEVFVPLCFEKSRWTTVAMLAVMKAGGAFVLLDPAHPTARLQMICQTVGARLVVASAAQQVRVAGLAPTVVPVGDDQEADWPRGPQQPWEGSAVTPDNALYAVFTSGSTGTPKGAVIPHAAFATSADAHRHGYYLTDKSRVFQFSSYAFDASIVEIITTVLVGGCVCIPSDTARQNNISDAEARLNVTFAQLTPSAARLIEKGSIPTLETLIFGGEPVTVRDIARWEGQQELVNGYGPAECSAISTVHPRLSQEGDAGNIGWAAACVTWVVDPADPARLLPIGAVGELLIEGPIVGRGYLNDPERTAAAFIAPPAWLWQFRGSDNTPPGGTTDAPRLYKTGDLVQYAADGSLRFVGRKDTQVKLRGQRIELGEVGHHTRARFAGAREVVAEVVTPREAGRPPALVAFVWVDGPGQGEDQGTAQDPSDVLAPPSAAFRAAATAAEAALLFNQRLR